jgi:hypothetical protein
MSELPLMILAAIALALACARDAGATDDLPYTTRLKGYTGIGTTVHGDIRGLGMAGAMVGLADTVTAAGDNPAGLAMTLESTGAQLVGNRVRDGNIQNYDEPIDTFNVGAAASAFPWGFGVGYWIPYQEGQVYHVNGGDVRARMAVRELRFSGARLFFDKRLSLGASLIFGQSLLSQEPLNNPDVNPQDHTYAVGGALGGMYRFDRRWLLGISYSLPMTYMPNSGTPTSGINSYFQATKMPWRLNVGTGWIPNRFFRLGLGLYMLGTTDGVALLSDQDHLVGQRVNFQPRAGVAYTLAEFSEFKAFGYAGSYLELSRVVGTEPRLHGTVGFEMNVWIFNLGWGLDGASKYRNFIFSAGLDVIRLMRKIDMIPPDYQPKQAGWLPDPRGLKDEGLPRPLVTRWKKRSGDQADISAVLKIGKSIPGKIKDKVNSAVDALSPKKKTRDESEEDDDAESDENL